MSVFVSSIYDVKNVEDFLVRNYVYPDKLYKDVTVVGVGALIANGLSYIPMEGNLSVLTPAPWMDRFFSGIYRYWYIPGYDTSVGFTDGKGVPTPERAICDCIMYPQWCHHVLDAIRFYLEDDECGSEEDIVETALRLGIPEEKIREEIEFAKSMADF